jgi:hypothetical protein
MVAKAGTTRGMAEKIPVPEADPGLIALGMRRDQFIGW